jgi:hypothetical protein
MLARRKSMLDSVGAGLDGFRANLGSEDRRIVEAHFESIRELEMRLSSIAKLENACGAVPARIDPDRETSYPLILRAQMDLMVAALKCGVTHVTTLQTTDATGSNMGVPSFVAGLPVRGTGFQTSTRSWAEIAQMPVLDGVDHKRVVERWFFERFAELLAQLAAVPEGGGSLLDNTIVVIGNNTQDGPNGDPARAPWMLAGKGGGALDTGTCLPSGGLSIKGVMAAICQAMGVPHPYGAPMPGLLKGGAAPQPISSTSTKRSPSKTTR